MQLQDTFFKVYTIIWIDKMLFTLWKENLKLEHLSEIWTLSSFLGLNADL